MGQTQTKTIPYISYSDYKGAGILFTDGNLALAGIQKYNRQPAYVLSGLGGRREPSDRDWCDTAFREVVEELLGLTPSLVLLDTLRSNIPITPRYNDGYVLIRLDFLALFNLLRLCSFPCPHYTKRPTTLSDLLIHRILLPDSEIGSLALIPALSTLTIATEFLYDISKSGGASAST